MYLSGKYVFEMFAQNIVSITLNILIMVNYHWKYLLILSVPLSGSTIIMMHDT